MTLAQVGRPLHSTDEIRSSYDAQADESYSRKLDDPFFERYGRAVGRVLAGLGPKSLLDAGCGDGVVLHWALDEMRELGCEPFVHGIDVSHRRISIARKTAVFPVHYWTASFLEESFQPRTFDLVFTSHSLEPNGGKEVIAIRELVRIASEYVVLFEPDYDAASPEGKRRMDRLNYVRHIRDALRELGLTVERDEPFSEIGNPLNPTNLWVVRV